MSKTKTTHQGMKQKKYISFTVWSTYAIDLENKLITPADLSTLIDLDQYSSELNIDWYEHTVSAIHKIDYDSEVFKKNIERAHTINHHSHDVAIYKNSHDRAFCIRIAVDDDIVLVELM